MKYLALLIIWMISFNGIVIQHDSEGSIKGYGLSENEADFIGRDGFAVFYDADRAEYDRTKNILTAEGFDKNRWKIVSGKIKERSRSEISAIEEVRTQEVRAESMIYEKTRAMAIKELKREGNLPEDFR